MFGAAGQGPPGRRRRSLTGLKGRMVRTPPDGPSPKAPPRGTQASAGPGAHAAFSHAGRGGFPHADPPLTAGPDAERANERAAERGSARAGSGAAGSGAGAIPVRPPAERRGFYADHFGFHDHPFALMPDPSLILWSRQYRRAFSVLEYGVVSGAPITLLTGGIGCGKTTLLRELLSRLDQLMTVGLISNAQGGRGELVQWVLNALGQGFDRKAGYVALFQQLQDAMVAEYAAGRRTLLIFDEAQNLSLESLEELRMLTNINTGKDVVVQLLLVGQPELRATIHDPRLEQLAQRIAVSYDLTPLDQPTTADFIRHRLQAAGGSGEEFDAEALAEVFRVTRGVPRLINQFCDISLLYAWTADQHRIGADLLQQVLEDNIFFAFQNAAPLPAPDRTPDPAADRTPDRTPDRAPGPDTAAGGAA